MGFNIQNSKIVKITVLICCTYTLRTTFTPFKASFHNLEIECDRNFNINRECRQKKRLQNENHFVLICQANRHLRQSLIRPKFYIFLRSLSLILEHGHVKIYLHAIQYISANKSSVP